MKKDIEEYIRIQRQFPIFDENYVVLYLLYIKSLGRKARFIMQREKMKKR
jgi:hypothetical protein